MRGSRVHNVELPSTNKKTTNTMVIKESSRIFQDNRFRMLSCFDVMIDVAKYLQLFLIKTLVNPSTSVEACVMYVMVSLLSNKRSLCPSTNAIKKRRTSFENFSFMNSWAASSNLSELYLGWIGNDYVSLQALAMASSEMFQETSRHYWFEDETDVSTSQIEFSINMFRSIQCHSVFAVNFNEPYTRYNATLASVKYMVQARICPLRSLLWISESTDECIESAARLEDMFLDENRKDLKLTIYGEGFSKAQHLREVAFSNAKPLYLKFWEMGEMGETYKQTFRMLQPEPDGEFVLSAGNCAPFFNDDIVYDFEIFSAQGEIYWAEVYYSAEELIDFMIEVERSWLKSMSTVTLKDVINRTPERSPDEIVAFFYDRRSNVDLTKFQGGDESLFLLVGGSAFLNAPTGEYSAKIIIM